MSPANANPEYEPLNPGPEADSDADVLDWAEKQEAKASAPSSTNTALVFWTLCVVALLSVVNSALYPRTVSTSAKYYSSDELPHIGSSPGLEDAFANNELNKYNFNAPGKIAEIGLQAQTATFNGQKEVEISDTTHAILKFTVPPGSSSVCAMTFFRPPITVTSSLAGSLKKIEVWEILNSPDSAMAKDELSFDRDAERMLTTLDLTKQAQMAVGENFVCGNGEERVFEIRCAAVSKRACEIKYTAAEGSRIGFQLSRLKA